MNHSVEQLYTQYGPMVLRRCRVLLRNEARAVDAMHDVFVLVLRHHHTFETGSGCALLFRLATNVRVPESTARPETKTGRCE